jgi:hypothetical protein
MIGLRKCSTQITTLIGTNVGMVLQVQCQAFFELGGKRLTNAAVISRFEAGEKP